MSNENVPKLFSYNVEKADFSEIDKVYILELIHDNTFIKINEKTKKFIDEIDGIRTYEEIAIEMNRKYNINLTEQHVKNIIINKLGKNGLVEGIKFEKKRTLQSKLWFHWNLLNGNDFEAIAKNLTFLYNPFIMTCLLSILIILCINILNDVNFVDLIGRNNINYFKNINFFIIFIMLLFTSVFHELGHIVASFRCGARPRNVGIGLYLLMPVLFVDLSESWLLDRKKRVIIDLGGIYFQLISMLFFFPMIFFNNPIFNIINYKIIVYATLTNVLFNLNPTLKMDGYWALSDLTGVVNIHYRTRTKISNRIKRIFGSKDIKDDKYKLTDKAKKIFFIWSILYSLVTVLFIYIAILKIMSLVNGGMENLTILILGIIAYLGFKLLISICRGKIKK